MYSFGICWKVSGYLLFRVMLILNINCNIKLFYPKGYKGDCSIFQKLRLINIRINELKSNLPPDIICIKHIDIESIRTH